MADNGGKIIASVPEAEGVAKVFGIPGSAVIPVWQSCLDKRVLALRVCRARESLRAVKLTQYGPEQLDFLRYRPVLDNRRLKEDFGYTPAKTSREAFDVFVEARNG